MKTIFITMADPMTVRNIFRTPFWSAFCTANAHVRIVVLTQGEKREYYAKTFGAENVIFEGLAPQWKGRKADILGSFARSTNRTHTNTWSKMRSYLRGDSSFLATWGKRVYTFFFGGCTPLKHFLRAQFLTLAPATATADLFDRYKPSLVISTYVTSFEFDVPVNTEAKRRGIRTIGLTRSWDTLSSHGMLRVVPDALIVQSRFLKECASRYQAIDEAQTPITVIGLPHYDAYKNLSSVIETREAFFARMGLDPQKKLLVYGAMGDFLFPHEGGVADVFEELIHAGKIEGAVQVIYRAHPKFKSPVEKMQAMKHVRADRGATYQTASLASFELEDADEHHLMNTFHHADVIITTGSTFAQDAAAFDKPTICIAFDGIAKDVPYWESVKRFYDRYTHFEELVATKGVRLAYSPDELAHEVNRYLADPTLEQRERLTIVELLAAPFDGRASERLEHLLTHEIQKL